MKKFNGFKKVPMLSKKFNKKGSTVFKKIVPSYEKVQRLFVQVPKGFKKSSTLFQGYGNQSQCYYEKVQRF